MTEEQNGDWASYPILQMAIDDGLVDEDTDISEDVKVRDVLKFLYHNATARAYIEDIELEGDENIHIITSVIFIIEDLHQDSGALREFLNRFGTVGDFSVEMGNHPTATQREGLLIEVTFQDGRG